jgi:hypothetical protein
MKKLLPLACLSLLLCGSSFAQRVYNSDRCEVAAAEITGKKSEDEFKKLKPIQLGAFDTIIGEEELTTRVYRLPRTKLFVIASIFYTDESMASDRGNDSISMSLAISTKPKRDVLNSLSYSDAEAPEEGFDVGRVTTMYKAGRRVFMIVMECRKPSASSGDKS